MSLMAVPSVLPDSRLNPSQVEAKFALAAHGSPVPLPAGDRTLYLRLLSQRRSGYGYGMAGLGGLGQSTDSLTTVDPTTGNIVDASGNVVGNINTTPVATATLPSGQTVASSTTDSLLNNLVNQGFDLAKLATIQPGTSQAGGSITRQSPGYAVSPIATDLQTTTTSNVNIPTGAATALGVSTSSVFLIGGAALIIVMMMMAGKRQHN